MARDWHVLPSPLLSEALQERLLQEYAASLFKYPDNSFHMRRNGATQEASEAIQALSKYELQPTAENWDHFVVEALQSISTLCRALMTCAPENTYATQDDASEIEAAKARRHAPQNCFGCHEEASCAACFNESHAED